MAISEVKNLTGGPVRYSHVKLFIALEAYFLREILNMGGLHRTPTPQIALMGPTSTVHCVLLKQAAFLWNAVHELVREVLEAPELLMA